MKSNSILKIENLSVRPKSMDGKSEEIVRDIDLDFQRNKVHFLLGPNGCGKSTTVKAVMHLLDKDLYEIKGKITALDRRIWNGNQSVLSTQSLREFFLKNIRYINQNPAGSLDITVKNDGFFREIDKRLYALEKKEPEDSQNLVNFIGRISGHDLQGVSELLNTYPIEISGGQIQILNIALSLYGSPRLIIADEGFEYLDIVTWENVLRYLVDVCKKKGKTLLIICHDYQIIFKIKTIINGAGATSDTNGRGDVVIHSPFTDGFQDQMKESFFGKVKILRDRIKKLDTDSETLGTLSKQDCVISIDSNPVPIPVYKGSPFRLSINERIIIAKGSIVGIIGESGSGKTTFARMLGHLIGTNNQFRVRGLPKDRTDLQYVYQIPYPCFNRVKNPLYMLEEGRNRSFIDGEEVNDILLKLNAAELAKKINRGEIKKGTRLSGGELQMICLCRAMLWQPEVFLLDEPFNNLDYRHHTGFLQTILSDKRIKNSTRILILHDIILAMGICNYIIAIDKGNVIYGGPVQKLINFIRFGDKSDISQQMLDYLLKIMKVLSVFDIEKQQER